MSCILVLAEQRNGTLRDITFEMLSKAQEIARTRNLKVNALLLGDKTLDMAKELQNYSSAVITFDDEMLANFNSEIYERVIASVYSEHKPTLILIGNTAFGTDLAPSLAVKLDLPLVTDCIDIKLPDKNFLVVRQMYLGKINAELAFKTEPAIITIRPGAFKKENLNLNGEIIKKSFPPELKQGLRTKFLNYEEVPITGIDITKASIIISVGRGIKEQKNIPIVDELAKLLGGVLGCTRPIIDSGWLEKDRQIGSSGKTVKPKLYISFGISGAFQHIAGIKGSEIIIAVNKDPNAPIFSVAHYGIIGDLFKIVPALKSKIQEIKERNTP